MTTAAPTPTPRLSPTQTPRPRRSDASRIAAMISDGTLLTSAYPAWGLCTRELSFEELRLQQHHILDPPPLDVSRTTHMITNRFHLSCSYPYWGLGSVEVSFEEQRLDLYSIDIERTAVFNTILQHILPELLYPAQGDTSTYLSPPPEVADSRFHLALRRWDGGCCWFTQKVDRMWRRRCRVMEGLKVRHEFFDRLQDWEGVGGMVGRGTVGGGGERVVGGWEELPRQGVKGDGERIVTVKRGDTGGLPRAGERFASVVPQETLLPWEVYAPLKTDPYCVRRGSGLRHEVVVEADLEESEHEEAVVGTAEGIRFRGADAGKVVVEDTYPLPNSQLYLLPLRPRPLEVLASRVPQPAGG